MCYFYNSFLSDSCRTKTNHSPSNSSTPPGIDIDFADLIVYDSNCEEATIEIEEDSEVTVEENRAKMPNQKRKSKEILEEKFIETMDVFSNHLKKHKTENNTDACFAQAINNILNTSMPATKIRAQADILSVLSKYQLEDLNSN